MNKLSVRYIHKITPRATDVGRDVTLDGNSFSNRNTLGAALRKAGVLGKGERLNAFRVEGDRVVCFPAASIWHAIVLTFLPEEETPMPRKNEIRYTIEIEPEEAAVRGNALASGDDAADRACEEMILDRLDRGDDWAWACVRVVATWDDPSGAELVCKSSWLGCCSYANEADFRESEYYAQMVSEANEAIQEARRRTPMPRKNDR